MQRERQRLAVLVDEHSATAGLVTFEDLMEELVGEVMSEHERGGQPLEREPSGALVARGDVAVREIARALHVEIKPPPNINRVGGLCASLAGGVILQRGARLADPSGLILEVTEASPRFVRRVRIIPPAPPAAA